MTQTEALKMALEALEEPKEHIAKHRRLEAITAIKEALAQPEQEPVAWADHGVVNWIADKQFKHSALLYEAPKRKPLTDKQILADETLRYYFGQNGGAGPVSKQGRKVVDAIEAAHGIKE